MPLTCDCYPGCWGAHVREQKWPSLRTTHPDADRVATKLVPHGSLVVLDDFFYFETRAYLDKFCDALDLLAPKANKLVDPVNPPHYQGDYVMRIIEDFNLGFCLGNTVKYVLRAGKKNNAPTLTDLKKALWYLQRDIATKEKAIADAEANSSY